MVVTLIYVFDHCNYHMTVALVTCNPQQKVLHGQMKVLKTCSLPTTTFRVHGPQVKNPCKSIKSKYSET